MNVETFRGMGKHPGIGPLARPESNALEHAFIAPDKFPENAAMPLKMNLPRKDLDAGNPNFTMFFAIGRRQQARLEPGAGKPVGKRLRRIVAQHERFSRFRRETFPKLFIERRHNRKFYSLFA
jgi:hypothetical protein